MSPINLKALPLHRLLALVGAALLLVSLFLPWLSLSFNDEFEEIMGVSSDDSISGWDGLGRLAGAAAAFLLIWEALRLTRRRGLSRNNADLITLSIASIAAMLAIAQFVRAVANSETADLASTVPGVGAYLILVSGLVLICAVGVGIKSLGVLSLPGQATSASLAPSPPPPASRSTDPAPDPGPPPPPPPAGPQDM